MEDGFIRSNGLGASLIDPLSVVIDKTGIYYNALQPSDLEHLLIQQPPLNTQQQNRTQALIKRLLDQQVSKWLISWQTSAADHLSTACYRKNFGRGASRR